MFRKFTNAADAMTIAPGMVMISFSAIALGAAFGGYLPLIALWMETLEVSFQQIGIVSGASALGIIFSAYFAPHLAQKYGYVVTINIGLIIAAIMTVLFRYTENYAVWLAIRFVGGLGLGLHWVLTEAWLANIVSDHGRTRVMAIYATAISVGFAAGPGIIWLFGFATPTPFYLIAAFLLIAALPIYILRGHEPNAEFSSGGSPLLLIRRAPTVASACIVAGGVDLALISLVPAMVARSPGAEPVLALSLVPAMALGTMLLQYPIAIMADRYGLRKVSIIIATTGVSFCSLIPFFLDSIIIAIGVAFLGAGLVYGLYSIGLAMLSKRFTGGEIVAANAGFVIIFEAANLMGPGIAGVLLDMNIRLGLPIFMISIGVFYLVISWVRRHANPDD
ncbi:MAG: MFS transporter [Paracoccaceae bacterium]|nr:MFS transporter [Paracoccaceae bacterium]